MQIIWAVDISSGDQEPSSAEDALTCTLILRGLPAVLLLPSKDLTSSSLEDFSEHSRFSSAVCLVPLIELPLPLQYIFRADIDTKSVLLHVRDTERPK